VYRFKERVVEHHLRGLRCLESMLRATRYPVNW
jgi:hypothetical protein